MHRNKLAQKARVGIGKGLHISTLCCRLVGNHLSTKNSRSPGRGAAAFTFYGD